MSILLLLIVVGGLLFWSKSRTKTCGCGKKFCTCLKQVPVVVETPKPKKASTRGRKPKTN